MTLHFTKMHGIGNDFMVIDGISQKFDLSAEVIQRLSHRQLGIGFDQLLLVESSDETDVDFKYRIFNADGGEVEQCGNGARCFARFVREKGLTQKSEMKVETLGGLLRLKVNNNNDVIVNMGLPEFTPEKIPFMTEKPHSSYDITVEKIGKITLGAVSIGNPHGVLIVDNVDSAPVQEWGVKIESHPCFPARANIGFMQIIDRSKIRLRVFERGASETLACGSGACAAVVSGIHRGLLNSEVTVQLPGGTLCIQWAQENQPVFMTGPASTVFEGTIDL